MPASTRPESIELLEPNHLWIQWADGHDSLFTHRQLRLACECARCVDEWTRAPLLDPDAVAEGVRITKLEATGNYGVVCFFNDTATTGIYTFERLRTLGGPPA
ncbi:MAG: DUF971 domain-containing protein [Planctomycetes bacterium]|nr:DUF971 domain-containing protein [Planctomycetota bacterium]